MRPPSDPTRSILRALFMLLALAFTAAAPVISTPAIAQDAAPVVTTPATAQAIIGVPMSFTVSAADPDGDAITSLTASGTAFSSGATFTSNATNTSGTFSWTAGFFQTGSYSATFTAANALSGSGTTVITVCACDRAPVVTAPAMVTGAENVLITFTVSAADPDGDAITNLTATGTALTAGGTFTKNGANTSGTFSWTPTFTQVGSYSVTFTASNALSGTATTNITICDSCGARAPVTTAPTTVSSPDASPITFTVSAVDPDGDAITSLTAAGTAISAGATFTTNAANTSGTFQWSPTLAQEGNYAVTFTASNSLSGSATTQITVGNPGASPVVTAPSSVGFTEGVPFAFTVSAADPDGDAITSLTASGTAITAGASFTVNATNTSGTLAWTPTLTQAGFYSVTFTASNSLSTSRVTQVFVAEGGNPPLQARAFTLGGNKTIHLNSGKPFWCGFLEPGGAFSAMDIDVGSVVLRSPGTGSVTEIPAHIVKSIVVGDADKNDMEDVEFCFTKDNLRLLFDGLHGRVTVNATIAGRTTNLTPFSAPITIVVVAGGGGSLAATISPNPLNPTGTLSFRTDRAGTARVRVYDGSGRLVRTIFDASLPAGRHSLPFDARSSSGNPLPTGVYFYRVESVGEVETGRFTVLK